MFYHGRLTTKVSSGGSRITSKVDKLWTPTFYHNGRVSSGGGRFTTKVR